MLTDGPGQTQGAARRALLGGGELTREDAEALQSGRPAWGWFGRPSLGRNALLAGTLLFWFALLIFDWITHVSVGKVMVPLVFVVLGVPTLVMRQRRLRRIQRGLSKPPASTD